MHEIFIGKILCLKVFHAKLFVSKDKGQDGVANGRKKQGSF